MQTSPEYRESLTKWAAGLSDDQISDLMVSDKLSDEEFDAVYLEDVNRMQKA